MFWIGLIIGLLIGANLSLLLYIWGWNKRK